MRNLIFFLLMLLTVGAVRAQAAAQVMVTNVADFGLGNWGMTDPAISQYTDLCIYASGTAPSASYGVTITSDNGAFFLANGSKHITYSLYWEDSGASHLGTNSPGTLLTYGTKATGRANANTNSLNQTCTAGLSPTARLTLKITQAAMQAALAGTYTDKIYISISPI